MDYLQKYSKYKNKYNELKNKYLQDGGLPLLETMINNKIFSFENLSDEFRSHQLLIQLSNLCIIDRIQFNYYYKYFNDVNIKKEERLHEKYNSVFDIKINSNNEIRIKIGDINKINYRIKKVITLKFILENFNYYNDGENKILSYSQDGVFKDEILHFEIIRFDSFYDDKDINLQNIELLTENFNNNILNYTKDQIKNILEYLCDVKIIKKIEDLELFYNGCIKIAHRLNQINYMETHNVIIPGDSPYKIYLFIQKNNLCPNCNFIQFPISNIVQHINKTIYINTHHDNEPFHITEDLKKLFAYCSKFFPKDNIENTTIIDYVNSGASTIILPGTFEYMLNEGIITNDLINQNVIKKMKDHYLNMHKGAISGSAGNRHLQNSKYYINTKKYFDGFMASDLANTLDNIDRCVPSNKTYEIIETEFDNKRCKLFVYATMLYKRFFQIKEEDER